MELVITFGEKEMSTPVYIKLDAADQLLLSEGVCRLLGIVSYHSEVQVWRGGHKNKTPDTQPANGNEASVPTVRATLVKSIRVPPYKSIVVPIEVTGMENLQDTCLLEPDSLETLQAEESFVTFQDNGKAQVVKTNITGAYKLEPNWELCPNVKR